MRTLLNPVILVILALVAISSCSKSSGDYSATDHTSTAMLSSHKWSGFSYGYTKADTIFPKLAPPVGTDSTIDWPKHFYHVTTDTVFSVVKVNGFTVNVLGVVLLYRSTDAATHIIRFDSTYAGSGTSFLVYDYLRDTLHYEFHQITGHNDVAHEYYEFNQVLSGVHP